MWSFRTFEVNGDIEFKRTRNGPFFFFLNPKNYGLLFCRQWNLHDAKYGPTNAKQQLQYPDYLSNDGIRELFHVIIIIFLLCWYLNSGVSASTTLAILTLLKAIICSSSKHESFTKVFAHLTVFSIIFIVQIRGQLFLSSFFITNRLPVCPRRQN